MANKKSTKKKQTQKKSSVGKNILVSVLALVIGLLAGYVLANSFAKVDLEFTLNGKNHQKIGLNSEYKEKGVVCIFKGEDYSSMVTTTYYDSNGNVCDKIVTTSLTTYYVEYKIETEKFSYKEIRLVSVVETEDLEINFIMFDSNYAGDCIYIKAGDTDILVDAGANKSDAGHIAAYLQDNTTDWHSYVEDGKLEYLIATHAHEDHIAALVGKKDGDKRDGILSTFEIETLIDFPKTNSTTELYKDYTELVNGLVAGGTTRYSALECYNNENGASRIIEVAAGIEIEILYNYYYENETKNENNYSVCFMLRRGDEQYLFTGDLEGEGEEYLADNNELGEVYLLKLGHHGSESSTSDALLSEIKPKVAVATCAAFTSEYTKNTDVMFPSKAAIDNLAKYNVEHLYVSRVLSNDAISFGDQETVPANGHIVVSANSAGTSIYCSNEQKDFYEFDIFQQYRTWTKN